MKNSTINEDKDEFLHHSMYAAERFEKQQHEWRRAYAIFLAGVLFGLAIGVVAGYGLCLKVHRSIGREIAVESSVKQ